MRSTSFPWPEYTTRAAQPAPVRLTKPLRVCHLGKYYPPAQGGIETHLRTLAQAQAQLGAQVQIVCVNHFDRRDRDVHGARFAAADTVSQWDGPVRIRRLARSASLCRWDLCPGIRRKLLALSRHSADVFHLHVPNPTMLLALATIRFSAPLVITYHSDIVRQKLLSNALRPFEHVVFSQAQRVLATSPAYATGSATLKRYAQKVDVFPFGVNLERFRNPGPQAMKFARQIRDAYGWPLWIAVGRLVYYKGLDVAIKALAQVPGKLLIVGSGPLEAELRRQAKRMGVADRVIWKGPVTNDQLVGAYHAATALWFPSNARSEAFGLVQVEAMASGCPVINTNIPHSGVPWVCRHGESGLTVPINDWQALAAAARRLYCEPMLRQRLSAGARDRSGQFDHRRMARQTLDLYGDILGDARLKNSAPVILSGLAAAEVCAA